MKTINFENLNSVENIIMGICDNQAGCGVEIKDLSKAELVELADAFDAGDLAEEIAELLYKHSVVSDAIDAAREKAQQHEVVKDIIETIKDSGGDSDPDAIKDTLEDGKALAALGIDDQEAVEAAHDYICSVIEEMKDRDFDMLGKCEPILK